jgi:DnaK suppressor protein
MALSFVRHTLTLRSLTWKALVSNQDRHSRLLQLEASLRHEFDDLFEDIFDDTFEDTFENMANTQWERLWGSKWDSQPRDKFLSRSLSELIEWMTAQQLGHHSLCQRLMRLDAAYCQLELGLYGLCADCETQIEAARLSQDPTAQRCNHCDNKYHRQHRQELRLDH